MELGASQVISTILRHDNKVTSYKIALLRAINDVVLSFPDVRTYYQDVAVPLKLLAEYWVAYYWAFVDAEHPIIQGQQTVRDGKLRNDIDFRPALSAFRSEWKAYAGGVTRAADGFFVAHELRIPRKRATYPAPLLAAYQTVLTTISRTLKMPIQHAGPGHWTVFDKPATYTNLMNRTVAVPGTQPQDICLVIKADLWQTFQAMSLWIEALCIHEWCLFTERINQSQQPVGRGRTYELLTDRPDNRRPLTWESNQIDILLMEGHEFRCPWTAKSIITGVAYDIDHLLPLSIYPINELWNLIPTDPTFNRHKKRDRLPSAERLLEARHYLEWDYERYGLSRSLSQALQEDVRLRFSTLKPSQGSQFSRAVTEVVVDLIEQIAQSRNLARF